MSYYNRPANNGNRGNANRNRNGGGNQYHKRRNTNGDNYTGWQKPTKPWNSNQKRNSNSGCCADENWTTNSKQPNDIYKSPYEEPFFDSHCHFDWILFKSGYGLSDFPTFSKLHLGQQFGGAVTNACSPDMIRPVSELINSKHMAYKHIYGTFGLHPHNAKEWNDAVKQRLIFALKTGQWNIEQSKNTQSTKANVSQAQKTWLCVCGHENAATKTHCGECSWEPNQEYLQNVEVLNMVKKVAQNETNEQKEKENKAQARHPKVVAVGECGLDYHYNHSPKHIQKHAFIEQIEISKQLDLPLVVHAREAEQDTIEIMQKYCPKNKPIHLHCFTDSLEYGKIMLDSFPNLMLGFTGSITFKNAYQNRNTVQNVPLNRILLETDGPYMAPVPYRGRVSHPGYIPLVAEQIAKLHGIKNVNYVLKQCRINARKVYGV